MEKSAPNYTKALRYFEEAAAQGSEADSLWNAGKMHLAGEGGANASAARGIELYRRAAAQFGHFDAVMELGRLHQTGYKDPVTNITLVARSCSAAAQYLRAAAERGSWNHALRAGFDAYLDDDVEGAALRYAAATQLGYSVAASNTAFLLHFRTAGLPTLPALHGYGVEQGREQSHGVRAVVSASPRSARNGLRVAAARYYAFAARADQTPCAECEMRVAELQLAHLAQSLGAGGGGGSGSGAVRAARVRRALAAAADAYAAASARGIAEATFALARMTEAGMAGGAAALGDEAADVEAARFFALAESQQEEAGSGEQASTLEHLVSRAVVWSARAQLRLRRWLRAKGYDDWVSAALQPRSFGGVRAEAAFDEDDAAPRGGGRCVARAEGLGPADAGRKAGAYTAEDVVLAALVGSLATLFFTLAVQRGCGLW